MITFLSYISLNKAIVIYVLVISIIRGLLLPDFRYDVTSIILIQIIYPVALFAPLVMKLHCGSGWAYFFLCIFGISIAAAIAFLMYYFDAGSENITDRVSVPVFIMSFVAQVGFLSVLYAVLLFIKKAKSII